MVVAVIALAGVAPAAAYMCEGTFAVAEERIKEAESKAQPAS